MGLITVKGDKIKHGGQVINSQQDFVTIKNKTINVDGSIISTHSVGHHKVHSNKQVKAQQQSCVSIKNKNICIDGDPTNCGSSIGSGQQKFISIS